MALVLKDRVKVTTTTTGTGAFAIGGAQFGFQDFSTFADGDTTYYTIVDTATGAWETGLGTYSVAGPSLARTQVLASSTGTTVNFGAGPKDVFVVYPAGRAVLTDGAVLTGPLSVPAGASGAQVPQAQEVVGVTGATGSAKIPSGTTAQRDGSPGVGYTRFNSTLGRNETWNGSVWVPEGIATGATISLSGTAVDATGIPAGVKRITFLFDGFSFTGGNSLVIQLGTSSGVETTGYLSGTNIAGGTNIVVSTSFGSGFIVYGGGGANLHYGRFTIERVPGTNRWIGSGSHGYGNSPWAGSSSGAKTLAAELDRIRFTGNGGESFDAGSITFSWEY